MPAELHTASEHDESAERIRQMLLPKRLYVDGGRLQPHLRSAPKYGGRRPINERFGQL
jgi:hypothetical protein